MGNKSRTLAAPADVQMNPQATAAMDESVDTLAALQAGYAQERDLVNQLLGQAQMAGAFEEFSRTVRTSKLAYVKEHKLYRAIRGMKTPNGSEFSGTWGEFCELIGMSPDKADLDISNLKAFGEEALESMSRMGIGYRELRQYRRLPQDQKLALIEAAKAGDKGEFLDLAEELIARHAKEKETLAAEVSSLKADATATTELLEKKNARIDKLEREKSRIEKLPPDEALLQLQKEATAIMADALGCLRGGLRAALMELNNAGEERGQHSVFMAGLVGQVAAECAALREEFDLPDVSNAADAQLAAEVAQWGGPQ